MTEKRTYPFYRNDDEQFRARAVDDRSMECWEQTATDTICCMEPGGVNWPMIVRSLIAEVRRLRGQGNTK